jgi:hypothetical protein
MTAKCDSTFHNVDRNEDGSPAIESQRCARPSCEVYLCRAGCEHLSFVCDGCGLRFCDEHKVGDNLCLGCALTGAELEAEEHAVFGSCTCRQTDADMFDPRGCESHDSESPWNVRLRVLIAVQQYEETKRRTEWVG